MYLFTIDLIFSVRRFGKSIDAYVLLYRIKVRNDFDFYDEYSRTEITILTVFANSISFWLSLFSCFTFLFDFLYAKNFNNYKIIQNILSKIEQTKLKELKELELNNDSDESNLSFEQKIKDYNIVINEDYSNKENLIDNSNEEFENSKNETLKLPKLHFFDYIFNNFYCGKRCCCKYNKQMLISTSNQIIYKYFSIENILYNQLKFENLLKDYKWNNPRLKSIKNIKLINQLNNYLLNI